MGGSKLEDSPVFVPSRPLELAMRASDEILDLLPIATSVCDAAGRIVQYNRRAVELWGFAPQPGETYQQFTSGWKYYDAQGRGLPHSRIID
jgi:PAS domain-containing protein